MEELQTEISTKRRLARLRAWKEFPADRRGFYDQRGRLKCYLEAVGEPSRSYVGAVEKLSAAQVWDWLFWFSLE